MTDREKERAEKIIKLYQEFIQTDEYKKLEKEERRKSLKIELSLSMTTMALFLATIISAFIFDLSFIDFYREKQPFVIANIGAFISLAFIWGVSSFFSTLNIYESALRVFLGSFVIISFFVFINFYANLEFNVSLKKLDISGMQKFKEDTSKSTSPNFWFAFDKQNAIQRIDEKIQNAKLEQQSKDLKKLEAMKQIWLSSKNDKNIKDTNH